MSVEDTENLNANETPEQAEARRTAEKVALKAKFDASYDHSGELDEETSNFMEEQAKLSAAQEHRNKVRMLNFDSCFCVDNSCLF